MGAYTAKHEVLADILILEPDLSGGAALLKAGYSKSVALSPGRVIQHPSVVDLVAQKRLKIRQSIEFKVAHAHEMLLGAFEASQNSTEMVAVVDALCKLHGLYEPLTQNTNTSGIKRSMSRKVLREEITRLEQKCDPLFYI